MAVKSQYLDTIGTNHLIQALKKWQSDKLDNYVTLNTAQTITGVKTFQASIKSTTSGANIEWGNIKIYGGGSNGGSNSILIGDDVTIGDCNVSGSFGMVSTGSNAGFRFFNSAKVSIGGIQSTNGTLQWFTGSELKNILHAGNSYIKGSTITIDGSSITPLTSLPSHTHNYLTVSEATQENLNSSYHDFQVLYIGGGNNFEGKPKNVDAFGLFRFRVAYGWSGQMLLANGGDLYIRSAADASLNKSLAWKRVIDSGNIGSQSVAYATKAGSVAWDSITGKPSSFNPSSHEHNYILDIGNNNHTTFAYSKPGLSKDSITWLAVWNGYELRAMNKDQIALSGHIHDDRYVKKVGDIPEKAYDLIISPTFVSGSSYIDTGGGIHVKANTGTKFQLWLHDTSNVWYKKTNDGAWKKMDAGQADNADTTDGVHLTWSGTNDNPTYLASWDDDGKAIRAATRANITVGNSDKLDGVHLNGLFTAFENNGHNIKATIGGVSKEFLVNWAADSDKLDGLHSTSFAPYNGVKFGHGPDSNVWHQILQFTTNWVGQVTFMYSPEECQRDYWGIFNINVRSKDIWFQGFNLSNLPEMKCVGDDANNWSVWVKGNANSYDPYGTIQVLNFTNATIKSVGLSKSQSTAPSGTYVKSPTILSAGKVHNVTLWGQSFDGTNNVSGSLSNTGTITASAAATYDIGSNSLDYRYGYFQWIGAKTNTNLRLAANNSDNQIVLHTNGNVGVGTNSPSRKLHVAGNIYTSLVFEGPYARLTDQNGAVVIGNSTNARLSAIDQHIIFNTGGALRFGETDWDWNQWAGLRYTHSNKTIYLGIADNSIFTANSEQKNGTLKFPNVSTIEACSIRIEYDNEINSYSGDLYLNHRGKGGSNGNTANIRMLNNGGDLFLGGQLKFLASEAHIGYSSGYSDPWSGLNANFKFGGILAATHIYSNGGFHKSGSDDSHVLLGGGGHALISDLGSLSSRRLLSNSEFAKGNNFLQYFNFVPNSTSAIGNAGPTVSEWYHIIRMNHGNNAGFFVELAAHFYDKGVFYRSVSNGSVNTNWKRFLTHNGTIAFTSFNTYYEDGIFDMDGNPNGASGLLSDSWNQTIVNLGASFSKTRIKQLAFNYSDDTIKYRRRGDSGWTPAKTIAFLDSTVAASNVAYTLFGNYTHNGGQQNPNYFGKNRVGALMMNTSVNGNSNFKDWLLMDCYEANDVGGGVAFGVNRQTLGAYIMRSNADRGSWVESAELVGTHNFRRIFRQFYPSGSSDVIDVNYPLWVAYATEGSHLSTPTNSFTSTNSSTGVVTQHNYETRWVPIAEGSEYCSFMLTLEDTNNSRANVYNFIVSTGYSSGEIHQLSTNDFGGVVRLHLMLRYSGQNWVLYLAASTTISNPTVGSTGGFTYGNSKYIAWIHVYLNTVLKGSPTLLTISDLYNKHRIPGTPASYGNSKPITPYFRNTNTDPTSSLTYEKTGGWGYKMLSPCPIKGATSEKIEFKSSLGNSSYIVIDPTITIPSTTYSGYQTVLGYQGIKTYNINAAHINVGQLEVNTSASFQNSVYLNGVLYGLRVGVDMIWETQTKKISEYKNVILMYKTSTGSSSSNKTSTIVLDDTRSGRMLWVKNTTNDKLFVQPSAGTIILVGRNTVFAYGTSLEINSPGDGMMFIFCPGTGSVGSTSYTVGVWEGFKHPRDW
nr:MAG TPA: tail protein [Caudoviricetes sp.]